MGGTKRRWYEKPGIQLRLTFFSEVCTLNLPYKRIGSRYLLIWNEAASSWHKFLPPHLSKQTQKDTRVEKVKMLEFVQYKLSKVT